MGANNGAPGGGKGNRFWVSEKTEPHSFQPQSNNINKKITLAELSRETHLVQMNTHASFLLTRRITSTSSHKESLNTKGITAAATQELIKKITLVGTWMQWREKAWVEMPMWIFVLTPFILLCRLYFFSSTSIFPNQIKQQSSKTTWQRLWGKLTFLPSPLFVPHRIHDKMGLKSRTCFPP